MQDTENFNRQYRFAAGPAGGDGFEIGAATPAQPVPLHISFSLEKSDLTTHNTGKISLWNLSKEHLSVLNQEDCAASLRAGYKDRMSLIFAGIINHTKTSLDGSDRKTEIELTDNLIELRDTYVSVSYQGKVNWKTIYDDTANKIGVVVSYSYNAEFADIDNGFSYVGPAQDILNKGCDCCGLSWSIQNGVLQIKKPDDVMSREVYVLSSATGLIGIPSKITDAKSKSGANSASAKKGWEVEFFLNGAINIDDFVKLESDTVSGYFRVAKIKYEGDNLNGDWICTAQLLEVAE